jgi:hypothetical protein
MNHFSWPGDLVPGVQQLIEPPQVHCRDRHAANDIKIMEARRSRVAGNLR